MALASSLEKTANKDNSTSKEKILSPRRRQVHILYLLNDLLHHIKYHAVPSTAYSTLSSNLQSYLVDLVGAASTYDPERYPNHHEKIQDLLRLWDQKGYYQSSYINKLRVAVANSASLGDSWRPKPVNGGQDDEFIETSTGKQDAPYIMPASHGEFSTPYYDLPAGNLLPHIIPNSTVPINPQQVKPLQFNARPADESLIMAVKSFMKEVDSFTTTIGSDEEGIGMDIDELGQPIIRNEENGEFIRGEGYYGWSKAFCVRMKRRHDGTEISDESARRSDSIDRSTSPRKRRRYSSSGSSRRSYSSSRSVSRSPRHRSRTRSPFRQRSSSYSPPPVVASPQEPRPMSTATIASSLPPQSQTSSRPLPTPLPHDLTRGFPLGPGGLPIPPPPPNYRGPWPPPPPPLPPGRGPLPQGNSLLNFPPFVPPPLPPPIGPGGLSSGGPPPLPYAMTGPHAQIPHSSGGWGPQQNRGYPASATQPPYSGQYPSGRGRGHRGG